MIDVKDQVHDMGFKLKNNLKKEYEDACKDEKFVTLIKKIKLDENILMKYTSQLQTCSENYDICLNCKNILECKQEIKGYCYLPNFLHRNKHLYVQLYPCGLSVVFYQ